MRNSNGPIVNIENNTINSPERSKTDDDERHSKTCCKFKLLF